MTEIEVKSHFQEVLDEYDDVHIDTRIKYMVKKDDDEYSNIWVFKNSLKDCIESKRPSGFLYKITFSNLSLYDTPTIEKIKEIIRFCMIRVGGKRVEETNIYSTSGINTELYLFTELNRL